MKKHVGTLLAVALLLVGVALAVYPPLSDSVNSMRQTGAIAGYVDSVAQFEQDRRTAIFESARSYNAAPPGIGAQFSGDRHEEYLSQLDPDGTGMMGYIDIDSIGCRLPVYHGTDPSVLQVAVGHIEGSALPVGGEGTHCVLSGHRGLPSSRLFTDLDKLQVGDIFVLHVLDHTLTYEVYDVRTVVPSDTSALTARGGEDLCTLVTCTPYGVNTHRLLVQGRRTADKAKSGVRVAPEAVVLNAAMTAPVFAAPVFAAAFILLYAVSRRRRKRNAVCKKLGIKEIF